jgi:hypothetical protein
MLIKTDMNQENEVSNGKWSDSDHIIKKIDYDNLERSLFINQMSDYHDLIAHVNVWAVNLGFLVKLKRPPKVNQDGSKTLRVYCASFKKSKPLDEESSINTGYSQIVSRCGTTLKNDINGKSGTQSVAQTESCNQTSAGKTPKKPCGVASCPFGLTFKLNPTTQIWLLYQEYSRE